MWTAEEIQHISRSASDFVYFTNNIFSKSTKTFIGGNFIDDTCRFLSQNKNTIMVSGRGHAKSFLFYSYFMWRLMFDGASENMENHYFSFNENLAGYHIGKIKTCIKENPYFRDIIDAKPTAENVAKYSWDGKHFFTIFPHGLTSFSRGTHTSGIIAVDDPFQDPDNELNLATIFKINDVMRSNIMSMPVGEGAIKIVGTAQSSEDFFFDPVFTKRFSVKILPARFKDENGIERALWPEWMDLEELNLKEEELTPRVFSREYLCTPVMSTKSFFDRDYFIKKCVDENLILFSPYKFRATSNLVVGSWDLGKKQHPAHFVVFEQQGDRIVMLHHKFMDGWDYTNGKKFDMKKPSQLEYIKMCIDNFNIKTVHYDNTRGELIALDEQGLLSREFVPVIFNNKTKLSMATAASKTVDRKQLVIPNDNRYINQICCVNSELQAMETKEGHGEAFVTLSLALMGVPEIVASQDPEMGIKTRKMIKTGIPSIFSSDKIPDGF